MKCLLASTLFAAVVAFGSAAQAAPVSPAPMAPVEVGSQVEKVHGYHRSCQRGPNRWHRHTRSGDNVWCGPRRGARVYVVPKVRHDRHHRHHDRRHH
jgi:hypothetical protein